MKFLYIGQLIKLNNVFKFHQISFSGLLIIMGKKTMVRSLRYDPTQHRKISLQNRSKAKQTWIPVEYLPLVYRSRTWWTSCRGSQVSSTRWPGTEIGKFTVGDFSLYIWHLFNIYTYEVQYKILFLSHKISRLLDRCYKFGRWVPTPLRKKGITNAQ